jgi:hypothetical protein
MDSKFFLKFKILNEILPNNISFNKIHQLFIEIIHLKIKISNYYLIFCIKMMKNNKIIKKIIFREKKNILAGLN